MKRLLTATLLILAAFSVFVPPDAHGRKRSHAATRTQASTHDMRGVKIEGNKIHFSSAWQVKKSASGQTYAWMKLKKKKLKIPVLVVGCKCTGDNASGTCFLQSMAGRGDALECKNSSCTGSCKVDARWIEIELPAGQIEPPLP
ncbi:MAG TPA: hypothetical protein VFI24_21665 [Pyrinomonadaceae bacterium]|nr:hypothetical protein [Pyrinomonadaceae bacterium]